MHRVYTKPYLSRVYISTQIYMSVRDYIKRGLTLRRKEEEEEEEEEEEQKRNNNNPCDHVPNPSKICARVTYISPMYTVYQLYSQR